MSMSHTDPSYLTTNQPGPLVLCWPTGSPGDEGTLYGKSNSAQELSISSFLSGEPLFT